MKTSETYINPELAVVLQRHREVDPAISRAERHVRQDPPRFQAARCGWVGKGDRGIPAGDTPTTPTEVRSIECSVLVFPTLSGYRDIDRATSARAHVFLYTIKRSCTHLSSFQLSRFCYSPRPSPVPHLPIYHFPRFSCSPNPLPNYPSCESLPFRLV